MPSKSSNSPFSKTYIEKNILNNNFEKKLEDYLCDVKKESSGDELGNTILTLIENIIDVVNKSEVSSGNSKTILNIALCLVHVIELMNPEQIVTVCDMCLCSIRSMVKDKGELESAGCSEQIWKTFIPKIVETMEKKSSFEHCGSRTSGKEYKTFIINTICAMKLNSSTLLPLTCMWIDLNLSDEEHEKVVKTLCVALKKVPTPPSQLPPFIHQLLILTKNRNSNLVILKLRDYLVQNLYNKLSESNNSEDAIESSNLTELIEAESVIIFHIEECAKYSRSLVTDLIKVIKSIQSLPQNCLDPFILALLLSLSNISMYEAEILRIIKNIITNCFIEQESRLNSGWIRKQEAIACDVENVFKTLIESNVAVKEKVLKGLVNISFALLCTNSSPKLLQSVVDKIRRSGRYMIILLIKKHRQVYPQVMHRLCQSLYSGELNYQYTDTLHQICLMCYYSAQEHITPLMELIKSMHRLPHQIIRKIIVAVLPLAKLKSDFRNALILTLRKMLFSKDDYIKQTAVFGFLQILKQMQLKQLLSSYSQNSLNQMKGPCLFTQMIMDVHSSQSQQQNAVLASQFSANKNEAVCLEVLGVLRRCLTQTSLVRSSLYKGFIECVHMNTDLCLSSMELLLEHLRQFYVVDTDMLPPLHMDKIVTLSERGEYTLQEPVAELLLVLGQVVNTAKQNVSVDNDNTLASTVEVLASKLDSLVERFIKCTVDTFSLSEESMDVAYRKEVTLQVLGVYEALMTYILFSLNMDSTIDTSNTLLNLFKQYNMFVEFVHSLPKAKPTTKKSDDKAPSQSAKKEEKSSLNIKLPVTVLDLKILTRFLEVLFDEESETIALEAAQKVRSKRELRHYVLSTVLHVLQNHDNSANRKGSGIYKDICALSNIIYKSVFLKWEEVHESDSKMSSVCLNIFYMMISIIINHYDSDFPDFLFKVTGKDVELGIKKQVLPLLKIYYGLISSHLEKLQTEDNDDERAEVCNILEVSLNTLSKITPKLNNECIHPIRKWIVEICETTKIKHKGICKQIVNLMLTLTLRDSDDTTILDTMTLQLGRQNRSNHKLEIMNKHTMQVILPIICDFITRCMNSVEWFLTRLKSHYNILQLYRSEEAAIDLCTKEKSLIQFSQLICMIVKNLTHVKLPSEATQCALRVLVKCYTMLNNITRYYMKNSLTGYKEAKFDCLVSFVSTKLSTQVADFIHDIEDDSQSAAKSSKFVNQLIPRVILEQENFAKLILMLSKRNKDNTLKVRLIGTRDYKLNVKKIQENVAEAEVQEEEEEGPEPKRSRLDTSDNVSIASSTY